MIACHPSESVRRNLSVRIYMIGSDTKSDPTRQYCERDGNIGKIWGTTSNSKQQSVCAQLFGCMLRNLSSGHLHPDSLGKSFRVRSGRRTCDRGRPSTIFGHIHITGRSSLISCLPQASHIRRSEIRFEQIVAIMDWSVYDNSFAL